LGKTKVPSLETKHLVWYVLVAGLSTDWRA
jgi:hypothetical protein